MIKGWARTIAGGVLSILSGIAGAHVGERIADWDYRDEVNSFSKNHLRKNRIRPIHCNIMQ